VKATLAPVGCREAHGRSAHEAPARAKGMAAMAD
jgi:hypothetical protein